MKKALALMLAVVMVFALAACGTAGTGNQDSKLVPIAKENLKIGVLHIGNPSDGAGYSYAHDQGIVAMQTELGLSDDQIVRKNNVNDSDASATEQAIREMIEDGCNVVFATSYNYGPVVEEMAKEFPKVIFFHCSGSLSNDTNFTNYFGRAYQARYLTGIVAGLQTETNKIGYVMAFGGMAETISGVNAFALGVASVNPDAKVYVKITNTWFDVSIERQGAEALLDMGCDVITQHQDTTAPQLAAAERNAWCIGYNSNMSAAAPDANLTDAVWNWGAFYTYAVKTVVDGTFTTAPYYLGMKEGLVDISPLTKNVKAGTAEKVEAARKGILDGSIKVFEGPIYDNQGNLVVKEGEVVADSVIQVTMDWYVSNVVVQ